MLGDRSDELERTGGLEELEGKRGSDAIKK